MGRYPRLTLPGYCSRPTLLEYCFRPFLLGYRSRQTLLGYCSRPTLDVAGLADAGILFPAFTAELPISVGPAGILFPTDFADLDTVGVVDVAVAGEVLLAVPDVFDRPELVAMVIAGDQKPVVGYYVPLCY